MCDAFCLRDKYKYNFLNYKIPLIYMTKKPIFYAKQNSG